MGTFFTSEREEFWRSVFEKHGFVGIAVRVLVITVVVPFAVGYGRGIFQIKAELTNVKDILKKRLSQLALFFHMLLAFLVFDAVLWLVVRAFIDAELVIKCLYALISAQSILIIKILIIDEILFSDPPELITSDLVIVEDIDKPIGNIYSLAYNWKRNRMGNPSDASNESDRIQVVTQPATNNIINEREADGLTRLMYLKDLGNVHKVKFNDGHYKYTTLTNTIFSASFLPASSVIILLNWIIFCSTSLIVYYFYHNKAPVELVNYYLLFFSGRNVTTPVIVDQSKEEMRRIRRGGIIGMDSVIVESYTVFDGVRWLVLDNSCMDVDEGRFVLPTYVIRYCAVTIVLFACQYYAKRNNIRFVNTWIHFIVKNIPYLVYLLPQLLVAGESYRVSQCLWSITIEYEYSMISMITYNRFELWRVITAPFLHANFIHTQRNMFVLGSFNTFEIAYGSVHFLVLYFIAAFLPTYLVHFVEFSLRRSLYDAAVIGASGAVYGIMASSLYYLGKVTGGMDGRNLKCQALMIVAAEFVLAYYPKTTDDVRIAVYLAVMLAKTNLFTGSKQVLFDSYTKVTIFNAIFNTLGDDNVAHDIHGWGGLIGILYVLLVPSLYDIENKSKHNNLTIINAKAKLASVHSVVGSDDSVLSITALNKLIFFLIFGVLIMVFTSLLIHICVLVDISPDNIDILQTFDVTATTLGSVMETKLGTNSFVSSLSLISSVELNVATISAAIIVVLLSYLITRSKWAKRLFRTVGYHGPTNVNGYPDTSSDSSSHGTYYYGDSSVYVGSFVNDKREGKGNFSFADGSYYEGDWVNNIMHGKGKYTFARGSCREGDFVDGKMHGKRKISYAIGDCYEGDFFDYKMHGKGKYTFASGSCHEGDYIDGKKHGKGKYTYADGGCYEGDYIDDKMHGKGKYSYADGNCYEGDYIDGKKHGKGKYTYANVCYEGDFFDDKMHGKGKFTYADGDCYEGDYADGKKHGKGKYTYASGTCYEGDYVDDKMHGKGKYTYANGCYEGDYADGKKHGKGKYTFASGTCYEGDYIDNKKHGKGKYTNADGDCYEGDFFDDKKHGKGKYTYANGDCYKVDYIDDKFMHGKGKCNYANGCYEGDYADGKMHGKGKYTYASGTCYEGDYIDGKKHGKGKYTYASGTCYEGDYIDDKMHGKGKCTYANGCYEGDYVGGKKHGKGKYTYANGDCYEGDYADGKMHGKGKHVYANRDRYEGDYADGKKHGKGKCTYADGSCYEGDYIDNKKHGKGKYTNADGDCYEGDYINGVFQADDIGIVGTTNSNDAESSD